MKVIETINEAQLTDRELIKKILKGNRALYELLIRRNNPYLYKFGRSYGFAHQDVEDLMQETYINAFLNLQKYEGRASFKTWLIQIMLSECNHKKEKSSYKNTLLTDKEFNETDTPVFADENNEESDIHVIQSELSQVVEGAVAKLPKDYRLVFSLRKIVNLSIFETAETLRISESNVKARLNRAKQILRKEIEKMYTPEDIFEFNLVYCNRIVTQVMGKINILK
jgi:RNA polymerase sigma-70 factor (ECF subfamily)